MVDGRPNGGIKETNIFKISGSDTVPRGSGRVQTTSDLPECPESIISVRTLSNVTLLCFFSVVSFFRVFHFSPPLVRVRRFSEKGLLSVFCTT